MSYIMCFLCLLLTLTLLCLLFAPTLVYPPQTKLKLERSVSHDTMKVMIR